MIINASYGQKKMPPKTPVKEVDNYTIQYLIVRNDKDEVLLQKNKAGWHTLVIRSNKNQSINEAMDSLANSVGLTINFLRLAGMYINTKDFLITKKPLLELILQQS